MFADALLYGLVVYLVFSLGMVIYANSRFMALFRKAQGSWQTKLYGFVDPQDFQSLATTPLKEAETVYIRTRRAAVTAYALTIIALVMLAILTPAPPRTASTNPDPQAYAIDAANDSTEANPLDLDNPRASEPEHDNPATVNATTAHPAPASSAVPDADAASPAD